MDRERPSIKNHRFSIETILKTIDFERRAGSGEAGDRNSWEILEKSLRNPYSMVKISLKGFYRIPIPGLSRPGPAIERRAGSEEAGGSKSYWFPLNPFCFKLEPIKTGFRISRDSGMNIPVTRTESPTHPSWKKHPGWLAMLLGWWALVIPSDFRLWHWDDWLGHWDDWLGHWNVLQSTSYNLHPSTNTLQSRTYTLHPTIYNPEPTGRL